LILQPIVEGQGDEAALPVVLRRLVDASGKWALRIGRPHRRKRSQLVQQTTLEHAIKIALLTPECGAILVVFDADEDCPKELAPRIATWAQAAAGVIPTAVVMANREYEAWFLGSIESLRGVRGIRSDAVSHAAPESPADAKGELQQCMHGGRSYLATADQAALSARFDLASAFRSCRSFRKLVHAFGDLTEHAVGSVDEWPPTPWSG